MKKSLVILLAVSICFGFLRVSTAATVIYDGSVATGIENIVVDGMLYDVSFVYGNYDSNWIDETPTFYGGTSTDAYNAGISIDQALNSKTTIPLIGPSSTLSSVGYAIPYEDSSTLGFVNIFNHQMGAVNAGEWGYFSASNVSKFDSFHYYWAKFNGGTPIPIPGAVWLLGSGLIGIVGVRRKFKK